MLNPVDPPLIMRDTVLCLTDRLSAPQRDEVVASVRRMVEHVQGYVPGYRLKQRVQFSALEANSLHPAPSTQVSVFLEVEGAAHYLPAYAGNLDIMTSAALRVGERIAARPPAEAAIA